MREQLAQVNDQGALPLELARGARAFHYHTFALDPIAALSRFAAANGLRLSAEEVAALARLRRFVLAGVLDPGIVTLADGVPQEAQGPGGRALIASANGLEILQAAQPEPELEAALAPHRPYRAAWLCGEVTGWWR